MATTMATKQVDLSKLTEEVFVRVDLDPKRIEFFRQRFENGDDVTPIMVTQSMSTIDGRHRIHAARLVGMKEIAARVYPDMTPAAHVRMALEANPPGPKPLTGDDIRATVRRLLDMSMKQADIAEMMYETQGVSASSVKQAIEWHRANTKRLNMERARREVAESSLPAVQAVPIIAARFKLTPDELREALTGKKRRSKTMSISKALAGASRRTRAQEHRLLQQMLEAHDIGDTSTKDALKVLHDADERDRKATAYRDNVRHRIIRQEERHQVSMKRA